jgi:pSer/pThr/pTyr-binding forkhead associated (FHA) protein
MVASPTGITKPPAAPDDVGPAAATTERLGATSADRLDALEHLEHPTRLETLAATDAAPGRYLVLAGGGDTRLVALRKQITHIGRGHAVDVRLCDPSVSRRHAILVQRAGGARILDDRSSNGIHVNGVRVESAELRDGDVIVIGRLVLGYRELP